MRMWRHLRAARVMRQHESATRRHLRRFASADPRSLSDLEVWSVLEQWFSEAPEYVQTVLYLSDKGAMREIEQSDVWREQARSDFLRVIGAVRTWHLALAERFVERGWLERREDYFLLLLDEIAPIVGGQASPDTFREIVAQRNQESLVPDRESLIR
jgi:hypothetical protein